MHYPTRHISASPAASAIAIAATLTLLLLALAAPAAAESIGAVATIPSPPVEDPASAEQVEPPSPPAITTEPVDSPEPVQATEAVITVAAGGGSTSSPSSSSSSPTSNVARPVSAAATGIDSPVPTKPDVVAPSSGQVPELVGQVRQGAGQVRAEAGKVVEPVMHSAKTAAQAVNRAVADGDLQTLPHRTLELTREILEGGPLGLIAPTSVVDLLPRSGPPSGVDAGAFAPPAASSLPSTFPAGNALHQRASDVDGLLMQRLVEFGGVEPLLLAASSDAEPAAAAPPPRPPGVTSVSQGGFAERFDGPAPLNGNSPVPSPGPAPMAASGPGGSSFVPIAALLALLALAAPAILRRLGEVPDFRAPTPFVCALERPG